MTTLSIENRRLAVSADKVLLLMKCIEVCRLTGASVPPSHYIGNWVHLPLCLSQSFPFLFNVHCRCNPSQTIFL
jgi:hypothetical protein